VSWKVPVKDRITTDNHFSLHRAKEALRDMWFCLLPATLTERLVIVVGTGHRVGSTWLFNMLRDLAHCRQGARLVPDEFLKFGTLVLRPEVYQLLSQLGGHVIFKSHSMPPHSEAEAGCATFVTVYRDPRDVLVSIGFRAAYRATERGGRGNGFRALPIPQRICTLIDQSDALAELEQWFRTPFAHKVRYEDLIEEPVGELESLAGFLGIPTNRRIVERIARCHSFEARSGRKPGQEKKEVDMRKGIVGDWRNHFDRACIDAFKKHREGRWNRLLVGMGYEDSADWDL
jgi:hypothetical protein